MDTDTGSFRRIAAITTVTAVTVITTTIAAQPATATKPPSDRPCFIAQPQWNTSLDGPPPTCPIPSAEMETHGGVCHYDLARLLHTPDAIEGWYAQCRDRVDTAASAQHPTTPDAINGWLSYARG